MINGETKVCCLIGNPVEHSLSPAIHNAAFSELGLNYVYVVFKVEESDLKSAIDGLRALQIRGANITTPYKVKAVKYLDQLCGDAREAEAVNTVVNENGILKGYNTDGLGALKALEQFTEVDGKKVVLLGAGGAGRSIATAVSRKASEVVILNRTEEKAVELASKLRERGIHVKALKLNMENVEKVIWDSQILINSTSVGMSSDESLIPRQFLKSNLTVLDIVYRPLETRLLRDAKERGCMVVDGLWMLVYQGAESFRIWTGIYPDIQLMRNAALKVLERT